MNINFESITLTNYKALKEATVKLNNRGIVMVKGINTYEATASSNGSGKTSIFSGLYWALYGKTPEGISNPSNRYVKGNCEVSLKFSVDTTEYVVTRTIKGSSQSVDLYVNGENKSGRNRTDTDKMIRDEILKMSSDIFLSLVYLSQGFGSRLSLLTPALRKDRLEQLTDTAKRVSDFGEQFAALESSKNSEIQIQSSEYSRLEGSKHTYSSLKDQLIRKLNDAANQISYVTIDGVNYDASSIPGLNEELSAASSLYDDKYSEYKPVEENLRQTELQFNRLDSDLSIKLSQKAEITSKLQSINQEARCPECHQLLNSDKKQELAAKHQSALNDIESFIEVASNDKNSILAILTELRDQSSKMQQEMQAITKKKQNIQRILSSIPHVEVIDTSAIQNQINEHDSNIQSLNDELNTLNLEISNLQGKKAVISHCRQLITKQFRAYLLSTSIEYLNSRLALYSTALFSNPSDQVKLSADSQKMDIFLGEADYETLSGGEQRRVDLIMMLAQRDLALEVAGMSCNLLIMDEIMESMDETATQSALSLLESQSHSVDSMFIISHNDYSLPIDSVITVTKGADRVATVAST